MTDVLLLCGENGEREFRANRLVLTSVSPFFNSALNHGWMETDSGCIRLPTVSPDCMEIILEFICTRHFPEGLRDKRTLMELLEKADYLQIENLVRVTFQTLARYHVRKTDFLDVYAYIQKLNNRYLIDFVLDYLSANFGEVSHSSDFLLLTAEQLMNIVQNRNMDRSSMEHVFASVLTWTSFDDGRVEFLEPWMGIFKKWCPECLSELKRRNTSLRWNQKITNFLRRGVLDDASTAAQKKKQLLVFGTTEVHSIITKYVIDDNRWCPTEVLPFHLKDGMDAVVYRNHVYFFGGRGDDNNNIKPSTALVKYCPFTNTIVLNLMNSLVVPVYAAELGVLHDLIYIVNGLDKNCSTVTTVQRYNPQHNTCQLVASTNKAHYSPTVITFQNALYVIGSGDNEDKFLEKYDDDINQWTIVTEIPGDVDGCVAALCNTQLFVFRQCKECMIHIYNFHFSKWTTRKFRGGPVSVNWLWATTTMDLPVLVCCDFAENVIHLYDEQLSRWVGKSEANENLGNIVTCCHADMA